MDQFEMYIYSDYLRQSVRIPDFDVTDDELIQFQNIYVPCGSEVLISMIKKETFNQIAVHNTQRVACNSVAVGYARKEFRFHNMDLVQTNDPKAYAKAEELVQSAQTIFKTFTKPRILKSDKAESLKDFNNAAMFQVSDVTMDPNNREGASAYLMSVKIWETDVIKEQWFYEDFTNQATDGGPIIISKP